MKSYENHPESKTLEPTLEGTLEASKRQSCRNSHDIPVDTPAFPGRKNVSTNMSPDTQRRRSDASSHRRADISATRTGQESLEGGGPFQIHGTKVNKNVQN